MLPQIADVVIIGGGVIGTSIVYYLANRGLNVVLLEKEGIGSKTSSAGEGVIFLQLKKPGIHLKIAMESLKQYKKLRDELDYDIEFTNHGTMLIIQNDEEFEAMRNHTKNLRENGLPLKLLDRKEAREIEPELSESIYGATFSPLDAQVNPMNFSFAMANSARKMGANILPYTEVLGIKVKKEKINEVVTNKGNISTNIVVNAAGIFAPNIGKMVNVNIPITPRRGQLLVTEVIPKILNRPVTAARYLAIKYNPDIAQIAAGKAAAIEPTENGNLLIGSTREFVGFNYYTTFEGIKDIAENAIAMVPKLKNISIIRTFAGLRPYTVDGLPILGKVDDLKGFIMAAGHEGDGIALAPITGELIAELIATGKTKIDLSKFSLERFK